MKKQFPLFITKHQAKKLADLFLDLSKGLLLAFFVIPIFSSIYDLFIGIRTLGLAVICLFLAMDYIEYKLPKKELKNDPNRYFK